MRLAFYKFGKYEKHNGNDNGKTEQINHTHRSRKTELIPVKRHLMHITEQWAVLRTGINNRIDYRNRYLRRNHRKGYLPK